MKRSKRRKETKMKKLISISCVLGALIFFIAAITAETHLIKSMVWILASVLMMAPHMRMTYIREKGN